MSRKSGFKRFTEGDEDFARAVYDLVKDTEITCRVRIVMVLQAGEQKGTLISRIEAVGIAGSDEGRVLARTEGSFPNSRAASLAAFLFAQMNAVSQMADSAVQDALVRSLKAR